MNISLPTAVLRALSLLNNAGFEAYVVGGCVRDGLMGKTPADWDITTSALPEQTKEVFVAYRTIDTGILHGTVTVIIDNTPLEVTTYRVDGAYSDGRHPDQVSFTPSLQEDLRRRDFTINAMAYHPEVGLVDFFGGKTDIECRTIRCVGIPEQRFTEDALRIIRALRFSAVLGFCIDTQTDQDIHRFASSLTCVSVERINDEFKRWICGPNAPSVLGNYRDVLTVFLPEIAGCKEYVHISNVPDRLHTRLAALFHYANVSPDATERALRRLRFDTRTVHDVKRLLSFCDQSFPDDDSALLRLLNGLGRDLVFDYFAIRETPQDVVTRTHRLLETNACYRISMLSVNGEEMMAIGIPKGPSVGHALQQLLYAVMDGACPNEKTALLAYAEAKIKPVQ